MDLTPDQYFAAPAACYVRGMLGADRALASTHAELFGQPLAMLTPDDLLALIRIGKGAGLRLHRFKRTMGLARVARVLGILCGLAPAELLDIGSGRGAFLWPLLDAFPALPVGVAERDAGRLAGIAAVRAGGWPQLSARQVDATAMPFEDGAFDVVTMLEVLEHIPRAQEALGEAVRVARRSVVLSVPSHKDDNPEHLHLFDQQILRGMFDVAGADNVRFEHIHNHLIAVARVAR